jgi:ornithine decarboxylase
MLRWSRRQQREREIMKLQPLPSIGPVLDTLSPVLSVEPEPKLLFTRPTSSRPARFANVESMVASLAPTEPMFCIDAGELRRNALRFQSFPGRVLYAVKCNPHPFVLETLFEAGIRDFDVASIKEVELVESLFGKAAGMFFNNPAKTRPAIRAASSSYGIRFYTVDHASELRKVLEEGERNSDLVVAVRLSNSSRDARYALSKKFGAAPEEAVQLLRDVHGAGIGTGLSFHVGSQCLAPEAFSEALETCRYVIRKAGVPVRVLNVGGGFPAPYPGDDPAALDHYFAATIYGYQALNLPPSCLLFCEPGRSLVATAASVVTQVVLRKDRSIYLNDGIFGSLQELRHPKERRPARIIRPGRETPVQLVPFRVFGPTCDSDDVLGAELMLPKDVTEGDWVEIQMMGAYSLAMQTQFNGFSIGQVVVVDNITAVKTREQS